MLGLDRERLEQKDPETLAAFETRLARIGYTMAIPDEVTLEAAVEKLRAMPASATGPKILVVDTLNRTRFEAGAEARDDRRRFEEAVEVCKRAAREIPALVLLGAEANRASASSDPKRRTDPLASAAEYRAIEHGANLQIVMQSTDDERTFEGVVAKNRIGRAKPTFTLEHDATSATLTERAASVDEKGDERAARRDRKRTDRVGKVGEAAASLLASHGPLNVTAIFGKIGGDKQTLVDALNGLEAQRRAEWVLGPRNAHVWRLKTPTPKDTP
jgi:hypothetical protein